MRCLALLFLPILFAAGVHARENDTLHIAVASNFKPTLQQINTLFTNETDIPVTLSSASTGALANQILQGAPFHLFFAADQQRPATIFTASKKYRAPPFCYAVGQLALEGADISSLAEPELSLAIANPVTAPYGRAALSVLSRPQFSAGQTRKLVRAGNVMQAYQFWYSGTVDLALVPRSLASGTATPIPASWHEPLTQYALVLRPGHAVNAYLKWLKSDTVRALIQQAGYQPCP